LLFKKNVQKTNIVKETEKTVLKIKTVDDIPVIKEMRKKIGNKERREAIVYGYINLKNDYSRYFGSPKYGSNRDFILGELKQFNMVLDGDECSTDNFAIKKMIENSLYNKVEAKSSENNQTQEENIQENARFFALKKIALFYFNYYEIARFGNYQWEALGEKEIIDPVKDAYNYMDIMKLFYNGESSGN